MKKNQKGFSVVEIIIVILAAVGLLGILGWVGSKHHNKNTQTNKLPNSVPVNREFGVDYYYAGGQQFVDATGASVSLSQEQPKVIDGVNNHSIMELWASTKDGKQTVEIGWIVQTADDDQLPHLWVTPWVDGQKTIGQVNCFDSCGFVQTSTTTVPNMPVAVGQTGNYGVRYLDGAWHTTYNGVDFGYFPESIWGGKFTRIGYIALYAEAEIYPKTTSRCAQMGNGTLGSKPGSARISNYTLSGSSTKPELNPYSTESSPYDYGSASSTGLNVGGPGFC